MGFFDDMENALSNFLNSMTAPPAAREFPGEICINTCKLTGEKCDECVREQKPVTDALAELKSLQERVKAADVRSREKTAPFVKCSLCGAPPEKGQTCCPYCDTPYPEGFAADIPESPEERQQLLLKKSADVYNMYIEWGMKPERIKDMLGDDPILSMAGSFEMPNAESLKVTPDDVKFAAEHYSVGYYEYVLGYINMQYKDPESIRREPIIAEQQKRWQEEQAERRARQEQEMRDRRAALEREREQRNNSYRAMLNMIHSSGPPDYGGGGSTHCCGNCFYWGAGKCCGGGYDGHSKSASDSCGCWKLK